MDQTSAKKPQPTIYKDNAAFRLSLAEPVDYKARVHLL